MLDPELLALLVCPETHQDLTLATPEETARLNDGIRSGRIHTAEGKPAGLAIDGALIRTDRTVAYPIRDGIPVMLVPEGLAIADVALV